MKKIPLNEMVRIQGGISVATMCFGLGILTVATIALPSIYYAWPAIKYCWKH